MYPLGHTLDSAKSSAPFLYGNIVLKTDEFPTMIAIAKEHERVVIEKFPEAHFDQLAPLDPENQPPRTLLRVGHIPSYNGPEYSLYLDNPVGVLLLVMLCFKGQDDTCVPVLKWIGCNSILGQRIEN